MIALVISCSSGRAWGEMSGRSCPLACARATSSSPIGISL